jgi:hypothetical protein
LLRTFFSTEKNFGAIFLAPFFGAIFHFRLEPTLGDIFSERIILMKNSDFLGKLALPAHENSWKQKKEDWV